MNQGDSETLMRKNNERALILASSLGDIYLIQVLTRMQYLLSMKTR